MDATMRELLAVASRLEDHFHEAVFIDAGKEFEIHAETRRRLRDWSAEQGLRLWFPSAKRDTEWLPTRRRALFSSVWTSLDSVDQVEQEARRALADWVARDR